MVFLLNIAAVQLQTKEYTTCIATCEKAAIVGMENRVDYKVLAKAYARAAKAYHLNGEKQTALTYYDKALSNHRLKDYLTAKQKVQAEVKEEARLAKINPENAAAAKAKGSAFVAEAKFPDAIKCYTEALDCTDASDAKACSRLYSNRAMCYTKLMELPHALKDSETVIKLDSAWVKGYLRKANCYFMMKEYQQSTEAYNAALKVDPANSEAKEGVSKCYMAKMGAQEGMSREEKADAAMKDPEVQQIMGDPVMRQILEQMQKDPESAQMHLKNPEIMRKIQKLADSGILEMR
jgi:stress-induced-phosphoprotein 1